MLPIGLFGFLGNTLTIFILSRKEMKNSFNRLLVALAVFDNIFICFLLLDYCFVRVFSWPFSQVSYLYILLFPKFIFPLNNIFLCCSVYLICCIAMERYSAVCKPFAYRASNNSDVNQRIFKYLISIIFFSCIVNFSRFFETELITESVNVSIGDSFQVQQRLSFELTELRKHPDYIRFYINWFRLVFTCVLPVSALIFFNCKICKGVRFAHLRSRTTIQKEINLAIILMFIVIVFLFCNIPRILINCYDFMVNNDFVRCPDGFIPNPWILCTTSFSHLCLVFSGSMNFIIYFVGGRNLNSLKTCFRRSPATLNAALDQLQLPQEKTTVVNSPVSETPTFESVLGEGDNFKLVVAETDCC